MDTSFDYDQTQPYIQLYPRGKKAEKRRRRAYCLLVVLGGLLLALIGQLLPTAPEPNAYVLETANPKHVRL